MKTETREVFDILKAALTSGAIGMPPAFRHVYEIGFLMGVQAHQVEPEFAASLMLDYAAGDGTPEEERDGDAYMLWNAEQTVAALRAHWEGRCGEDHE